MDGEGKLIGELDDMRYVVWFMILFIGLLSWCVFVFFFFFWFSIENEKFFGWFVCEKYKIDYFIFDKFFIVICFFYIMFDLFDFIFFNFYDFFMCGEEIFFGV